MGSVLYLDGRLRRLLLDGGPLAHPVQDPAVEGAGTEVRAERLADRRALRRPFQRQVDEGPPLRHHRMAREPRALDQALHDRELAARHGVQERQVAVLLEDELRERLGHIGVARLGADADGQHVGQGMARAL